MSKKQRRPRGNGEGTVYERKAGGWAGDITLGCVDGKRKHKTVYGKTQKEVNDKILELRGKKQKGEAIVTIKSTVAEVFDGYLKSRMPKVREQSYDVYR